MAQHRTGTCSQQLPGHQILLWCSTPSAESHRRAGCSHRPNCGPPGLTPRFALRVNNHFARGWAAPMNGWAHFLRAPSKASVARALSGGRRGETFWRCRGCKGLQRRSSTCCGLLAGLARNPDKSAPWPRQGLAETTKGNSGRAFPARYVLGPTAPDWAGQVLGPARAGSLAGWCWIPQRGKVWLCSEAVIAAQTSPKGAAGAAKRQAAAGKSTSTFLAEATLEQTRGRGGIDPRLWNIGTVGHAGGRLTVAPWVQRTFIGHDLQFRLVSMAGLDQRGSSCGSSGWHWCAAALARGRSQRHSKHAMPMAVDDRLVHVLKRGAVRPRYSPRLCPSTMLIGLAAT